MLGFRDVREFQDADRYLGRGYRMICWWDDQTNQFQLNSMLVDGGETITAGDRRPFGTMKELKDYWHTTSRARIDLLLQDGACGQAVTP